MLLHGKNHRPEVGRTRLGRQPYGRGSYLYGTVVHCRCTTPGWREQVNEPMSRGGAAEAMRRWWEHVATDLDAMRADEPRLHWYRLSTRLRRQFYCDGYTADASSCGSHAHWAFGDQASMARLVLCTVHARLLGMRH